jgi:hypothetical protein
MANLGEGLAVRCKAPKGSPMIVLPATLDRASRGEFFRYCGETFAMCIKAGVPPDKARQFAIEYTNEKIENMSYGLGKTK